eukprot:CCRYP_009598-RA/>CCRYP_009598-RA protein AED:0.42 eAED:0.42 QI:0/-1/0/1/-1/1/1/0/87
MWELGLGSQSPPHHGTTPVARTVLGELLVKAFQKDGLRNADPVERPGGWGSEDGGNGRTASTSNPHRTLGRQRAAIEKTGPLGRRSK